jgi:predicted permease
MRVGSTFTSSTRTSSGTGARSNRLVPKILVAAQVALSLTLLVGAGLFVRTLQNLKNQDFGFNRTNVLLIDYDARLAGYKSEQVGGLHERIVQRLEALPGVRAAALSNGPPITDGSWGAPISVEGYPAAPDDDLSTSIKRVTSHYFDTVGIPVLQGRAIGAQDGPNSPKVVVVNQTLAKHFFPDGNAIGHRFSISEPDVRGPWEIVGVVRDTKYNDPRETPQRMIYLPLEQMTGDNHFAYSMQIRADGDPAKIANDVRAALAEVDPALPLLEVKTISEHIDLFMENERLISQLASFFSLLALSLACVGLYGVMTYSVVQRTNEIGVRIALGARPRGILWMVLRESILLLGVGVVIGIPATLAATRAVKSQLFGLSPFDASTIAVATCAIAAVVLASAYLPAMRATKVDPIVALRSE